MLVYILMHCTLHLWASYVGVLLTWQIENLETAASSKRNLKEDGLYSSRAISSLSAIISGSSWIDVISRTYVHNAPSCTHHILCPHLAHSHLSNVRIGKWPGQVHYRTACSIAHIDTRQCFQRNYVPAINE